MAEPWLCDLNCLAHEEGEAWLKPWLLSEDNPIAFVIPPEKISHPFAQKLLREGFNLWESVGVHRYFFANLAFSSLHVGIPLKVLTADQLFLQLVGPRLSVVLLPSGEVFDEKRVVQVYGVNPWQLPDLWVLSGLPDEGIFPCLGLEHTDIHRLLSCFHSVEEMLSRLDLIETQGFPQPWKLQKILEHHRHKLLYNIEKLRLPFQMILRVGLQDFHKRRKPKLLI